MSEPFLFAFHFPDDRGVKRNTEMSREELLEVIDYLQKDAQHKREQHMRDINFLAGIPVKRESPMAAFKRFWGIH